MPKATELLDPRGQAVQSAMGRLGFSEVVSVRQGKRFEIEVEGQITGAPHRTPSISPDTAGNPVIENHTLTIE